MNIDTKTLSITGSVEINDDLEPDTEYLLTGIITPYGSDLRSNNEGSFNKKYKAKFSADVILKKGEKVIVGKDKTRKSQKLRNAVWGFNDEDGFYEEFMGLITGNVEEVYNYLKNI